MIMLKNVCFCSLQVSCLIVVCLFPLSTIASSPSPPPRMSQSESHGLPSLLGLSHEIVNGLESGKLTWLPLFRHHLAELEDAISNSSWKVCHQWKIAKSLGSCPGSLQWDQGSSLYEPAAAQATRMAGFGKPEKVSLWLKQLLRFIDATDLLLANDSASSDLYEPPSFHLPKQKQAPMTRYSTRAVGSRSLEDTQADSQALRQGIDKSEAGIVYTHVKGLSFLQVSLYDRILLQVGSA